MIKITFISTLAYNYFFPGHVRQAGGHTRIYNLARRFASLPEYQVSCVVGDFGQPAVMVKDGVNLIKAPIDNSIAFLRVLKILRGLKSDVYVDFIASPRLFLLYLLKKIDGTRYIFLTGSENDVTKGYRDLENNLFYWTYLTGLKNADAIISQVPRQVERLKRNYGLDSYLVLSPYFDIIEKKAAKKDTVLWVGRAASYKNPRAFVDLAERFSGQDFVMICNESSYDDGFMSNLRKRIKGMDNFTFLDYVPYTEMAGHYERAKLLVNTSDFEGFPNTFIEAAMNHTPILSLKVDPNGMLSRYKCGFCCDGDMGVMYKRLETLLSSEKTLQEMGVNAFQYAKTYHQLDDAVKKIDKIIRDVTKKEKSPLGKDGLFNFVISRSVNDEKS